MTHFGRSPRIGAHGRRVERHIPIRQGYKLVVVADSTRADAKVGELGVGWGSPILGLIGIALNAQPT